MVTQFVWVPCGWCVWCCEAARGMESCLLSNTTTESLHLLTSSTSGEAFININVNSIKQTTTDLDVLDAMMKGSQPKKWYIRDQFLHEYISRWSEDLYFVKKCHAKWGISIVPAMVFMHCILLLSLLNFVLSVLLFYLFFWFSAHISV